MRVGCYTLHIYCQVEGCERNDYHSPSRPGEYTGRTQAECLREARKDGWVLMNHGKKVEKCPEHRQYKFNGRRKKNE